MRYFKNIQFLLIFSTILLIFGCNKTKTDWKENYRERSKEPFGTYILYNEVKALFGNSKVDYLKENIHEYLLYNKYKTLENKANYLCIKWGMPKVNDYGYDELLNFVANGNNAFISLNYFDEYLKKQLKFTTKNLDNDLYKTIDLKSLKSTLQLNNKTFEKDIFKFDKNIRRNYFDSINPKSTIVLGTQKIDSAWKPNFVKIYHGKGAIYLHSQPIVFTNYYLFKNKEYVENVLSYLPNETTLWDPQIKYSKFNGKDKRDNSSVFKFFLKHPPLKWALYIFFYGLLLFLLFNARRKQRAIPVLEKLKNSTVDFTHTIANLYAKEEDHKNLADKKITYFLEKVRTSYLLDTNKLNNHFIEKLSQKSGNTEHTTRYLINTIVALHKKSTCTQEELMRLNTLIENFFEK